MSDVQQVEDTVREYHRPRCSVTPRHRFVRRADFRGGVVRAQSRSSAFGLNFQTRSPRMGILTVSSYVALMRIR